MKQVAVLKLGEEYYALDIMKVNNIIEYEIPNRIPHPKKFVKGVINLRGQIVSVLDLREILCYEEYSKEANRKIIIIENDDELFGLIIDEVMSISYIDESQVEDLDKIGTTGFVDVLESVVKFEDKLVAMLSIPKILDK